MVSGPAKFVTFHEKTKADGAMRLKYRYRCGLWDEQCGNELHLI